MTQEQIEKIVKDSYSDKIQMATLIFPDLNFLLYKQTSSGMREFKGYSVQIDTVPFETEQDVRTVIEGAIQFNQTWYSA